MEILIAVWIVCGIIAYAGSFAYWQGEYKSLSEENYREDIGASLFFGAMGIGGLAVIVAGSRFFKHGFKFY